MQNVQSLINVLEMKHFEILNMKEEKEFIIKVRFKTTLSLPQNKKENRNQN